MTVWLKRFALLPSAIVALTLGACSGAMSSPNASTKVPASELIEGDWAVTKFQTTYDLYPDNPIDIAASSDITFSFTDGSYGYVCFPACLGLIRAAVGTYVVDETRKTIRFTENLRGAGA